VKILSWWRRKRRFPEDFEGEWDIFEYVREMMEEMFEDMISFPEELVRERKTPYGTIREIGPIVYGFSYSIGPDGKPVFREFGNVRPGIAGRPVVSDKREPLVDIMEEDDEIVIIAELPGVNKEDIELEMREDSIYIKAERKDRKYETVKSIPVPVDPKTSKASFNNGILEVRVKKKEAKRGTKIRIE